MSEPSEITKLLKAWEKGDKDALDKLMPLVMDELRKLAKRYLRQEKSGHLLQTTALVNELYLKLVDQKSVNWQNRSHFFAFSAICMRQILIDYAKSQIAEKRGGKIQHLPLDEIQIVTPEKSAELLALDEALKVLEKQDKRKSQIVEMRYFGGFTVEETAEILHIGVRTVERDWQMAKAWLKKEI